MSRRTEGPARGLAIAILSKSDKENENARLSDC